MPSNLVPSNLVPSNLVPSNLVSSNLVPSNLISMPHFSPGNVRFFSAIELPPVGISVLACNSRSDPLY